jgi:uncharacterized glyoxalase superfamily protein PhnB
MLLGFCDATLMPDLNQTKSSVIPALRDRNAAEAIEWLCRIFGFTRHAVYEGPDGTIAHAELTLGAGMVMLGSGTTATRTGSIYLVVPDADEVYKSAQTSGAEIVSAIENKSYGGREFTCRDLEGHVWSVGTYDPWLPPSSAS